LSGTEVRPRCRQHAHRCSVSPLLRDKVGPHQRGVQRPLVDRVPLPATQRALRLKAVEKQARARNLLEVQVDG
ncbi:MAG: hypothetical protein ACK2VD_13385, partial [Anaerolineae bacterium]